MSKKYGLNEKELLILSELRKNSRQSLADISRKTNIPISTVFDKIKKLENTLITKHTSLIDSSKFGFNIKVAIFVKANKKNELKNFLNQHINVNTVHRITDKYDYFIEAFFGNMGELYGFIENMEILDIKKMNCYYIDEDVKKEGMLY